MDFKGKNILVYGAGKSGIGAAELLVKLGAKPVLFDQKEGATPESLIEKIGDEYRQDVPGRMCRLPSVRSMNSSSQSLTQLS